MQKASTQHVQLCVIWLADKKNVNDPGIRNMNIAF